MIRPKIIRSGVEASSVFMFTAIIVMTGLLGFWGLIIGVPVFAILYTIMHSAVDRRLAKKGLPTDTYEYYSTDAGRELYEEDKARRERHTEEQEQLSTGETIGKGGRHQVFTEELPCITEEEIAAYEKNKTIPAEEDEKDSSDNVNKDEASVDINPIQK